MSIQMTPDRIADRPSPDWSDPVWAQRLNTDIRRLIHFVTRPPAGYLWEDFEGDMILEIIRCSWSKKSQWDPSRGGGWVHWACKIIKHRSMNFHAKVRSRRTLILTEPEEDYFPMIEESVLPTVRREDLLPGLQSPPEWKGLFWSSTSAGRQTRKSKLQT